MTASNDNKTKMEICIQCGVKTNVPVSEHISRRKYYVSGAGQLCEKCYHKIYAK